MPALYEKTCCGAVLLGLILTTTPCPAAPVATTDHSFTGGADGAYPRGNVVVDAAGNAYGEVSFGGTLPCVGSGDSCGTIFKLDAAGIFTTLVSFHGVSNGATGFGDLALVGDQLYGEAYGDPTGDFGTSGMLLFRVKTDGSHYTVLHRFSGPDGEYPLERPVVMPRHLLYNTASGGGLHDCNRYSSVGCGTLFQLSADGSLVVLHDFTGKADGLSPGRIVVDSVGTLYGSSEFGGGVANAGILYSYVPATQAFTILHTYQGFALDGSEPHLGAIAPDGTIYGITRTGGGAPYYAGTLFQLKKTGSSYVYEVLWNFTGGRDGDAPQSGPTLLKDGSLIGSSGKAVYHYANGTLTTIAYFDPRNSTGPAGLVGTPGLSRSGTVIGTSNYGGTNLKGTVYSVPRQ